MPLTAAQTTLLRKLRKGTHGGLTAKSFQDLCTILPEGWSIGPVLSYKGASSMRDMAGREVADRIFEDPDCVIPDGRPVNQEGAEERGAREAGRLLIWSYDEKEAKRFHEWLQARTVAELPDPTSKDAPPVAVTQLGEFRSIIRPSKGGVYDHDQTVWGFTATVLARVKHQRIITPTGATFDLVQGRNLVGFRNERTFQHFVTWAAEETDFLDHVNALLGTEPYFKREDRPRTEDYVGTCGVCAGQFKTKPEQGDHLVKHGYERPGYGYLVGECFGTGYPPYELSSAACVAHHERLTHWHTRTLERLAELEEGRCTELFGKAGKRWTPESPEWRYQLQVEIGRTRQTAQQIQEDIAIMQHRIDHWEPHPEQISRPGQPAVGVPAAVRWARARR